jgi:hypothetical protein
MLPRCRVLIILKRAIQLPMQLVLDLPMPPHRDGKYLDIGYAGDKISGLYRPLPIQYLQGSPDTPDTLKSRPSLLKT